MTADRDSLRVVSGLPTADELAAVVAVLLAVARRPRGAGPAAAGDESDEPAAPAWLRGPHPARPAWTAGRRPTAPWATGQ